MGDDFTASLDQDFAPAWMGVDGKGIKPGDKIIGKVTEISEAYSDQSEDWYPIITILDEEIQERRAVHAFWIALVNELDKWEPQIGDRIAILYKEDKENKVKGRKPIKVFRVKIEGKTPKVFGKRRRSAVSNTGDNNPSTISDPGNPQNPGSEGEDLPF